MILFGNTQNKLSYNPPSVVIGTQTWALQNFAESTLINGTVLTNVTDNSAWAALTTAAWCNYNNDPAIGAVYGKLYNWWAIALIDAAYNPLGWRVATQADFNTVITALGNTSVTGGKMKEAGTAHWASPNTGADNSSGFTGLGGGARFTSGNFANINNYGFYWCSDNINISNGKQFTLYYNSASINSDGIYIPYKYRGFSIRLIKI